MEYEGFLKREERECEWNVQKKSSYEDLVGVVVRVRNSFESDRVNDQVRNWTLKKSNPYYYM